MQVVRVFFREVAADGLARLSGGVGILFTLASFAFPQLLRGPMPFLIAGAGCMFFACLRAWYVAHLRTLPRFEIITRHSELVDRWLSPQGGLASEYHRVIVRNAGLEPVEDIHVFLELFDTMERVIDLVPTGTDGSSDVTLYHDVARAFDLFVYDGPSDGLRVQGRRGIHDISTPRTDEPFAIVFSIAGRGVATQRYGVWAKAEADFVIVEDPVPLSDPRLHFIDFLPKEWAFPEDDR